MTGDPISARDCVGHMEREIGMRAAIHLGRNRPSYGINDTSSRVAALDSGQLRSEVVL